MSETARACWRSRAATPSPTSWSSGARVFSRVHARVARRRRRGRGRADRRASARYEGGERVDAAGRLVVPGLIDAHVHIESSKLLPAEFARVVVARGTTAVVCDPHELANVLGADGAHWLLDASDGLPLRVFAMAPSCVPASALESPRGPLGVADMARDPAPTSARIGVAEVMDFPSVIAGRPGRARQGRAAPARRRPRAGRARARARRLRRGRDPLRPRGDDVGGGAGEAPPRHLGAAPRGLQRAQPRARCSSSSAATGRSTARSARTTASRTCCCARGTSTRCAARRSPQGIAPEDVLRHGDAASAPAATGSPSSARSRRATTPTSSCSTTSSRSAALVVIAGGRGRGARRRRAAVRGARASPAGCATRVRIAPLGPRRRSTSGRRSRARAGDRASSPGS